jgi:murein DD-endopeptidase MepM/ murein hydrolase activator NlpD
MPADTKRMMKKPILLACFILLAACQPVGTDSVESTATQPSRATYTPVITATFTESPPTATPSPTTTPRDFSVCCPLEGETFESLALILSKPMDIPPFGQDTGHHGVDYAYFRRGERESIQGIEVYAILSGSVVLTLDDNYPYGFAVMVETPLSDLPPDLQDTLLTGYQPVPDDPGYRLYCPDVTPPQITDEFSVYHLYAHFEIKPEFSHGDPAACGELLGTVGNTGYSSNPHLHLETRIGPSGATFLTMAHYQNTSTNEQMSNYCLWRMSGYYQLFDPEILFTSIP